MTGDPEDMVSRLLAVLPPRWFPDTAPILNGLLAGLGGTASWLYGLVAYAKTQTRVATATGDWLDVIAQDFFGQRVSRSPNETDSAFRAVIDRELFRPRATRAALIEQVRDVTGRAPVMFEPMRPADTGGWGIASAYGGAASAGAGGWGSLALPFQCLVTVYRPQGSGIPVVSGYGTGGGGWGVGAVEYANLDQLSGNVTDAEILAAIVSVMPACGVAWTQLKG